MQIARLFSLAAACLIGAPAAAQVEVRGAPRTLQWAPRETAYVVAPDGGMSVDVVGPTGLLIELRSKDRGKRVIVDIVEGGRYRSRNALKLRPVPGGRHGYRFAALLALQVPAGKHTYELRAQGVELLALFSARKRFYREFAARPFEDQQAPTPEERAIATAPDPEPPATADPEPPHAASGEEPLPDPVSSRDADIFGSPSAEPAAPDPPSGDREANMFGSSEADGVSPEEAAVRLALTEDTLSIGGRLFTQFGNTVRQESSDVDLSNANLVDVYLDARPTDRVRGYLQGRLFYRPTAKDIFGRAEPTTRVALDQLWLKFDVARTLFITIGQQPIKWGTGRFWNPSDFVQSQARDPLAIVDDRSGVQLVKLNLPIESLGWNFVALANLTGASSPTDIEGAVRAEIVYETIQLAASAAARQNEPLRVGWDLSAGLFGIDFRFEWAGRKGVRDTFWRGELDLDSSSLRVPEDYQRRDEWLVRYVAGAELSVSYGSQDALTLGAEFFHNEAGYDDPDLYPWLLLNGSFDPLYVGREYFAAYAVAPSPGPFNDTTFTLSAIANLTDGSWLTRLDGRVVVLTTLNLQAFVAYHAGQRGELRYGFDIPSQPQIEGLERGLTVRAPIVELGVAALLNL
jgi:hypothetical protein